jgi:hypothetical protein
MLNYKVEIRKKFQEKILHSEIIRAPDFEKATKAAWANFIKKKKEFERHQDYHFYTVPVYG